MSTTATSVTALRPKQVEQAQRAALAQIAALSQTLPLPASLHVDGDGTYVVVLFSTAVPAWREALDLGQPQREPGVIPSATRLLWPPTFPRTFSVVSYDFAGREVS